jgi:hypothetical protein
MCQLQQPHVATNVSTSQHLKMGLVLPTEGGSHQTETYIPNQQCVEANGAGEAGVQLREVDKQECGWVGVQ